MNEGGIVQRVPRASAFVGGNQPGFWLETVRRREAAHTKAVRELTLPIDVTTKEMTRTNAGATVAAEGKLLGACFG